MQRYKGETIGASNSSDYDDGGADKSSTRLHRRRRQRIFQVLSLPVSLFLVIWILLQLQHYLNSRIDVKRHAHDHDNHAHNFQHIHNDEQGKDEEQDDHDDEAGGENEYVGGPNIVQGVRWADKTQLPPLNGDRDWWRKYNNKEIRGKYSRKREDFTRRYYNEEQPWEKIAEEVEGRGPAVDYTRMDYNYPDPIMIPPRGGAYPPLEELGEVMKRWPQDDIDSPPNPFVEKLMHFDYNDPDQVEAATLYRDLEFPFKMYNVPDLIAAREKWSDDYLTFHFDQKHGGRLRKKDAKKYGDFPPSSGHAQLSVDSFFAFFAERNWIVQTMGAPPTLNTDFTFEKWAAHARYADNVGLKPSEVHYYWQSGVPAQERELRKDEWTMVSRDLPLFSDPKPNFFSFNPDEQKGIQCRFGERGVTAATHYDGGRNMVGMITGAKRYILAPPKECRKLGIVTGKKHPTFRHSMLNFGHINLLEGDDKVARSMPDNERQWLKLSKSSLAIETVLKAGEVLYIPSHWFHYIISLQKSAQCNVRSGREEEGSPEFGGTIDVDECMGDEENEGN